MTPAETVETMRRLLRHDKTLGNVCAAFYTAQRRHGLITTDELVARCRAARALSTSEQRQLALTLATTYDPN